MHASRKRSAVSRSSTSAESSGPPRRRSVRTSPMGSGQKAKAEGQRRGVTLLAYLDARRADIEAALAMVLPAPPDCPPVVADAMRYSLTAGGKRLRPILCLASAD